MNERDRNDEQFGDHVGARSSRPVSRNPRWSSRADARPARIKAQQRINPTHPGKPTQYQSIRKSVYISANPWQKEMPKRLPEAWAIVQAPGNYLSTSPPPYIEMSIQEFIQAVRKLPANEHKDEWLRWLSKHEAVMAKSLYNQLAYPEMLLWLGQAAG